MIRVAFCFADLDKSWMGGINYFKNLLNSLASNPECDINPVIFIGANADLSLLEGFPSVEVIRTSLFDRRSLSWFCRKIVYKLSGREFFLERLLLKNKIQVLSHFGDLGPNAKVPSIGWIPDFQHLHLPHFFDAAELQRRDKAFSKVAHNCKRVILSSLTALDDFTKQYPQVAAKADVLHFVAIPSALKKLTSLPELESKYQFRAPYFFLPNQFWAHKNHGVVIEALAILKSQNKKVTVLCTGNSKDHRRPEYFNELNQNLKKNSLESNFRILGLIPYSDLNALMLNAVAVINPSLFEGWSTTVEEAKSNGKKIILSDIPVHREQNPESSVFFESQNPQKLSEILWQELENFDSNKDLQAQKNAANSLKLRIKNYAGEYSKIIKKTILS